MGFEKNGSKWETGITAQINSELKDFIPEVLENWIQETHIMRQALDKNNYEAIRNISHKMKGTGSVFGFGGISEMGRILESAAINRNRAGIEKTLDSLAAYIERVEIVY
jgi:hypothetical protein